jgi:alpha-galactosidase
MHGANVCDFEDELIDMDAGRAASKDVEEVPANSHVMNSTRSESREEVERQIRHLNEFYSSPSKKGKEVCEVSCKPTEENKHDSSDSSSKDSNYMPGDACSSEEDEEAVEILKRFKSFKKKLRTGVVASLDDVELSEHAPKVPEVQVDSEGYCTPYAASDDEDSVEEIGSDGQLRVKKEHYKRFNGNDPMPQFQLGMKFSAKKEFKDVVIKYSLHERKVVRFVKDDPIRVRAACDWPHCPWVCLCSKNSRTTSWQIATFVDEHTCPPRRDNKLVTAARIAEKYEKFILANPSWSFANMKSTVQEEMFADVSISKLKRAKAIVMQKVYDATKGQYEKLYDYQLELLRSNPGSTVVIHKEPDVEPPTFWRMYICLDACKKGFMAGCRKVVGLDGCFSKVQAMGNYYKL